MVCEEVCGYLNGSFINFEKMSFTWVGFELFSFEQVSKQIGSSLFDILGREDLGPF